MLAEAQLQNALSKSSSTTVMPEAVRLTTVTASKNPNNNHEFLLMGANGDGADEIGSVFSSSGGWSGASSFECCDDEVNNFFFDFHARISHKLCLFQLKFCVIRRHSLMKGRE